MSFYFFQIMKIILLSFYYFLYKDYNMDKIIKLNSVEGGPFTASQNRVTFEIPSGSIFDLSESYINLNFRVTTTDATPATGIGVYPVDLRWDQITAGPPVNTPNFRNVSLIKNARISSANQGQIENIRRVDQLKALLAPYTTSVEEKYSRSYHAASQIAQPRNGAANRYNLYQEINKVGSVASRVNENARVMIPLSELFDFCYQADEFDTSRAGTTTIHCELNVDKINAVSSLAGFQNLSGLEDITVAGDTTVFVTIPKFSNLEQSMYFVGQKILISGTLNGVATDFSRVISSIVWNDTGADEGKITLTLASAITVPAGQTFTDITTEKVDPDTTAVELNFAEIILTEKAMKKSDVDQIEYSTFSTEEGNGNGLTNFQRQYQVEPESDSVLMAFPAGPDGLVSQKGTTNFTTFRLRLDNEDLTDRSVSVNSPLYYDRINMTLVQMATRLKSLTQHAGNTSADAGLAAPKSNDVISIMNPLVQKPREKLLQVNISGAAINALVLFKHLPRVFTY